MGSGFIRPSPKHHNPNPINKDVNIEIINKILKIETKKLKTKDFIHEKNVIEFVLNSDGTISKLEFLKKSNDRKIDKITKEIIKQASSKFNKPIEPTLMRFIFVYEIGKATYYDNGSNNKTSNRETSYQEIQRGTTRFEHDSKEYVRTLETSKDGFINLNEQPWACASVRLLTNKNQYIRTGITDNEFNAEIPKGKYKLLIKTKKTCDINLQYL